MQLLPIIFNLTSATSTTGEGFKVTPLLKLLEQVMMENQENLIEKMRAVYGFKVVNGPNGQSALFVTVGDDNVSYLFVRNQFQWTLKDYTVFNATRTIVKIVGSIIGMYFLRKASATELENDFFLKYYYSFKLS
uniref:Uncharacterized protein n=1 Tax=Glossina austeni TaxID=7395 RepID=A0A1A9VD10_GLOAU